LLSIGLLEADLKFYSPQSRRVRRENLFYVGLWEAPL